MSYAVYRTTEPAVVEDFQSAVQALVDLLATDASAAESVANFETAQELQRGIYSAELWGKHAPGPRPGRPYWLEIEGRRYVVEVVEP